MTEVVEIKEEFIERLSRGEAMEHIEESQACLNDDACESHKEFGWSDRRVLQLIREIQEFPCLWDPRHKDRRNKDITMHCYDTLALRLGTSAQAVCKKFGHLLQTYRACRRKVKSGKFSGAGKRDEYKPMWFAYDVIHQFMQDLYMPYGLTETPDDENESDVEKSASVNVDQNCSNSEEVNEITNNITEVQESSNIRRLPFRRRVYRVPKKILKNKRRTTEEVDVRINEVYHDYIKRRKVDKDNDKVMEDDECSIFGNLVTAKLKKLDEATRQCVMNDLTKILYQAAIQSSLCSSQQNSSISSPYMTTYIPTPQQSSSPHSVSLSDVPSFD